jgi:hypothetical protein
MKIERQVAESIVNNEFNWVQPRDHRGCGLTLLRQGHYVPAVRELTRAIEDDPADEEIHYYLALALLGGVRPHRRSSATIDRVRRHLMTASALPEARVLHVLVEEDHGLHWRRCTTIPQALGDLVARVDRDRAEEILAHVPAQGARTFEKLQQAVDDDERDVPD